MPQVTKAAILAAGRGTRMKELTDELPKPMVAVKGRPILDSIVRGLVANGVEKILIVIGYRKEVITDYFGDGSAFGCEISYVEQVVQDGTGRVVELAKDFAGDDPFILSYGDILVPAESYAPLVDFTNVDGKLTVKIDEDVRKGGAGFYRGWSRHQSHREARRRSADESLLQCGHLRLLARHLRIHR